MLQSMQKQHVRQQLFDSMETCLGEPMARVDAKDLSSYIMQVDIPIRMNSRIALDLLICLSFVTKK